eukprot:SAG31_NODE_1024_length_10294_cov_7.215400_3_plen_52_part_00
MGATDGSTSVLSMLKSLVQKLAMAIAQEADEDEVRWFCVFHLLFGRKMLQQ